MPSLPFQANEPMSTRLGERPATSGPDGLMFIAPVCNSEFNDPSPDPLDPSPQTSDRDPLDADHQDPAAAQHNANKGQGKRWRGNPNERMQLLVNHYDT